MERAGRIAGKFKIADPAVVACAAWKAAAGKKVAEHSRAVAFVRGKLVVEVDDMVWQRQLHALRRFLLENLAKEIGEPLITDLDFRAVPKRRRPQAAAERLGPMLESDGIADPVMRGLYRESEAKRKKA